MVIGVLAVLIVPMIIENAQQNYFNMGVNQAYTILSQAVSQIQYQNGGVVHTSTESGLRSDFCNVMQCINLGTGASVFGQGGVYLSQQGSYFYYKSNVLTGFPSGNDLNLAAVLNNGMYLYFLNGGYISSPNGTGSEEIWVDINGGAGPNMWGEDLYIFWLLQQNNGVYIIVPAGPVDGSSCLANNPGWGTNIGCTYQRLFYPNTMP